MFAHGPKLKWLWCTELGVVPNHISTLFTGHLFSLPQSYSLHSAGKYIDTLVFIGRPTGITGLVAIDHATAVVPPVWEITYS